MKIVARLPLFTNATGASKTRRRINFIRQARAADLLVLSITQAIRNKIARINGRNIDAKLTKNLKSGTDAVARSRPLRRTFGGRGSMVEIRNRLFGNNNLVHSTENTASVGTMLSYVGPISVSAFFRISRWTTRDQIATRRSEREREREKEREFRFFRAKNGVPQIHHDHYCHTHNTCDIIYACWCVQECRQSDFTIVVIFSRYSGTRSDNGSFRETRVIVLTIIIRVQLYQSLVSSIIN